MELGDYLTALRSCIDDFGGIVTDAAEAVSDEYIEAVQEVTPVDTSDLRRGWGIKRSSLSSDNAVDVIIETDPVHHGEHYASRAEEYYDTHTSNSKGGNANSYRFRKLTEAMFKAKTDELLQKRIEKALLTKYRLNGT